MPLAEESPVLGSRRSVAESDPTLKECSVPSEGRLGPKTVSKFVWDRLCSVSRDLQQIYRLCPLRVYKLQKQDTRQI